MNGLTKKLRQIAGESWSKDFEWPIPSSCPIVIPNAIVGNYEKNVYLKENLYQVLSTDAILASHYWAIQKWGRIGAFRRTEQNDRRIRRLLKMVESEPTIRLPLNGISSLSKIASFICPTRFAIYDSRTIYSLNWLLFNYKKEEKLFPQPAGRSTELAKYDIQTIFRLSKRKKCEYRSRNDAYYDYCSLLSLLSPDVFGPGSKPYQLEMLLFMIAPTWVVESIQRNVSLEITRDE